MRAQQGDHIVLAGEQVGQPARDGEIIEVRGADGAPPYVVRWSDGHEGTFFPGPSAVVQPGGERPEGPAPAAGANPVREWQIRVSIFETADDTRARVALVTDSSERTETTGSSHRSPRDPDVPRIGEEVAVARALRHLADRLLDRATHDVEVTTGEHDVDIRPE
ncbi:DUF1918 domain-containing protein [Georgenia subflava]|uniref:DUF1918 domain-containing protein n=1 Tax=Georgenia subflava TaxID=1622177 RepID=A0A6N7EJD5_9MICO|nr:DUF1918 domain-containing protein [Georgenia subflava]MPV37163.1 DUF1918 domain-containing protein [Georgenia subflava]